MGSSVTPLARRDTPALPLLRSGRPGFSSWILLVALKVVLGVAGFAGFALLGAGGALLIKHLLTVDTRTSTPASLAAPGTKAPPVPATAVSTAAAASTTAVAAPSVSVPTTADGHASAAGVDLLAPSSVSPVASSATMPVAPAVPAEPMDSSPYAAGTSPSLPASASANAAAQGDAAIQAPPRTTRLARSPVSAHTESRTPRGIDSDGGATSGAADRASCLATLNAVNSDLSLRNEPPTPQQLAILKRGCK